MITWSTEKKCNVKGPFLMVINACHTPVGPHSTINPATRTDHRHSMAVINLSTRTALAGPYCNTAPKLSLASTPWLENMEAGCLVHYGPLCT